MDDKTAISTLENMVDPIPQNVSHEAVEHAIRAIDTLANMRKIIKARTGVYDDWCGHDEMQEVIDGTWEPWGEAK